MRSAKADIAVASTPASCAPAARDLGQGAVEPETAGQIVQAGQALFGLLNGGRGDLDGRAVMGLEHEEAIRTGIGACQQIRERGEVAEGLRHLLALDHHPSVVHPVVGEVPSEPHGLGSLVLVMGKGEVHAAAVEIEALTQEVEGHDHAFGVPSGPPRTPGRGPGGLTGLGLLPQGEVEGGALLVTGLHPGPGPQGLEALAGEQAVAGHAVHRQVDGVRGLISDVAGDEIAHERDHVRHVHRGVRGVARTPHAERVHGLEPHRLVLGRHLGLGASLR